MKAAQLAGTIARLALTKKAQDVMTMDLRGLTSMTDFFVVCSGDSDIQVKAIADAVEDGMETRGSPPWHRESGSSNWILLDFVDVVLHVFHKNTRPYYNLEKLWGDAAILAITDEPSPRVRRARRTPARTSKKPRAKRVSS